MAKHNIEVQVLAETRKATTALQRFAKDSGLAKLGGVVKTAAIGVAAGVGTLAVAGGALITRGIAQAGDLEQSIGAADTVFKTSAGQMHEWAKSADKNLGLTQDAYNQLATVMGTQLKNGGTSLDEIGGKTNELMTLGADLASMFGGSTADAVGALSSALKGERDPIERYGVSLKQATIDAKAAELGFEKVGGSLSAEGQQAATLALIMEQTADAHGNFAKEADTVQGKQARLKAQWDNLTTRIGTAFLPALAKIGDWLSTRVMPAVEQLATGFAERVGPALEQAGRFISSTVLPALQRLGGWITSSVLPAFSRWGATLAGLWPILKAIAGWLIDSRGWLIPLAAFIGGVAVAIRAWSIATAAWTTITQLAAAAQKIFNAVMKANPVGIIITIIAGLVAALIALYHSNEDARRIMDAAWTAIKGAIDAVVGWVVNTAVPWLQDAWAAVAGFVGDLGDTIAAVFAWIGDTINGFVQAVKLVVTRVVDAHKDLARRAVSAAAAFVKWWRDLPGNVALWASGLATKAAGLASSAGRALGDKIGGAAARFAQWFRDLPGKIVSWASGLATKAAGLASSAGRALGDKIGSAASRFAQWFRDLPGKIVSWAGGMFNKGSQIAGDVGRGLISGIGNYAGRIRDKFSSVIRGAMDSAKRLLGIASPSRVFHRYGAQTGEGLELGIESWRDRVRNAAADLARVTVTAGTPAPLTVSGAVGRAAGPTINLYVQALDPSPEVGRRIAAALRPYLATGGRL